MGGQRAVSTQCPIGTITHVDGARLIVLLLRVSRFSQRPHDSIVLRRECIFRVFSPCSGQIQGVP